MKSVIALLYTLVLSLWTGGMVVFTFIVTPVIFRSYNRDHAGEIVGRLFPGYFSYTLVLSVLAFIIFFLLDAGYSQRTWRLSVILLALAMSANIYISFKLYPDAVRIKQQVESFEKEAPESPARKKFRRIHAVSAVLNLIVLADGMVLLALSRNIVK